MNRQAMETHPDLSLREVLFFISSNPKGFLHRSEGLHA